MLPPDREATHQNMVEPNIATLHSHLRGDTHHHLYHLLIAIITPAHLHITEFVMSAHRHIIVIVPSAFLLIEIITSVHLIEIVTPACLHIMLLHMPALLLIIVTNTSAPIYIVKVVMSAQVRIIETSAYNTPLIIRIIVQRNGPPAGSRVTDMAYDHLLTIYPQLWIIMSVLSKRMLNVRETTGSRYYVPSIC